MTADKAQPIEINVDLRVADLYWPLFSNAIHRLWNVRWILAIGFAVLFAVASDRITFLRPLVLSPVKYTLLALAFYFAFVQPYLRARVFVHKTLGASKTLTYAIGPKGIRIKREGLEVHGGWDSVHDAKQTSELIVLHVADQGSFVIPKRCLAGPKQSAELWSNLVAWTR